MSIYVATHKAAALPAADWLVPFGLGGYTDERVRLNDAAGGGISHLNRQYCELTATHWLWRHCTDPWIGLCHYRRLFAFVPVAMPGLQAQPIVKSPAAAPVLDYLAAPAQHARLEALLGTYEAVVPQPVAQQPSIAAAFRQSHGDLIWAPFMAACRDEFGHDVTRVLDLETRFHYGNMIVARAEVFRDYASRLFRVVDRVFAEVGDLAEEAGARYQPFRYPGYLGERFTNLYLLATRTRFATAQSVWLD
jgi:hypothetical protein